MRTRTLFAGVVALGLGWTSGCSGETAAREALEEDGYTDVEIDPGTGDPFTWSGRHGASTCTGTISVSQGLFSKKSQTQARCTHSSVSEAADNVAALFASPSDPSPVGWVLDKDARLRLAYDQGPDVVISGDAVALPAVSALKAMALGDRAWLSDRGSSGLRTALRRDSFTLFQLLLSGPEDITLELEDRSFEPDGIRASTYRLSIGESSLELKVGYGPNGYDTFSAGGRDYQKLAIQRIDALKKLTLQGAYIIADDERIVTEAHAEQGPLTLRLSLAGAAHPEGIVHLSSRHTIEHDGATTEHVAPSAKFETDGIVHMDMLFPDSGPGQYRVTAEITDERTDQVLKYETVVDVLP